MNKLPLLLEKIRQCHVCAAHLPLKPNPILRAQSQSRLLIVGQAPGIRVHQTGIPWNDPSGDRLRQWLNIDKKIFYDASRIAIIPMGFCYPGTGPSGDLPPRKECAQHWLTPLLESLPHIQLTLLIGQYAQQHYLKNRSKKTLTDNVAFFSEYLPQYFPLPHPSPRNNIWLKRNPWFEKTIIPTLQTLCSKLLKN
ncbi:uracil-DNA glycosylase family protein [Rickettsiella endosymbiont of Dermanyssus gallinae]|uniref:uracil-DNA glycosylase family protein n=1 Tax=Rickettsiella endosymbiont of Dermanyssus gallinae TaxID=2856608 RepID=UPI001C52D72B|nr:uracil-DNA glycosylase family protein [Rickettsiella endosymbiont of Dermanyssus gallinae]